MTLDEFGREIQGPSGAYLSTHPDGREDMHMDRDMELDRMGNGHGHEHKDRDEGDRDHTSHGSIGQDGQDGKGFYGSGGGDDHHRSHRSQHHRSDGHSPRGHHGHSYKRHSRSRSPEYDRHRAYKRPRRSPSRSRSLSRDRERSRSPARYSSYSYHGDRDSRDGRDRPGYRDRDRDRPYHHRPLRSRSPSPDGRRHSRHHSRYGTGSSHRNGRKSRKHHPSRLYVNEPMLCQFVWQKDREIEEREKGLEREKQQQNDGQKGGDSADVIEGTEHGGDTAANVKIDSETNEANDGGENDQNKEIQPDTSMADVKEEEPSDAMSQALASASAPDQSETDVTALKLKEDEDYSEYNQSYCLQYVRTFFNEHLDNVWFRQRYSPLEYKRSIVQEHERAVHEAHAILEEVNKSLSEMNVGGGTATTMTSSFVTNARLGGGTKPTDGTDRSSNLSHSGRKRKYSASNPSEGPHYDAVEASGLPKSHLFSFLQDNTALHIMDIPPDVTDEHLTLALKVHADSDPSLFPLRIVSSPVVNGACNAVEASRSDLNNDNMNDGNDNDTNIDGNEGPKQSSSSSKSILTSKKDSHDMYHRDAWAIFEAVAAKEKILDNLTRAYVGHSHHGHVHHTRKVIELDVDCSDPYGRYDIDADGKGGAPSDDSSGRGDVQGENDAALRVPERRVPVFVSSTSPLNSQNAIVLSAAVSSATRIQGDKDAAVTIARRLDVAKNIPSEARLESILQKLFPQDLSGEEDANSRNEDLLDVAIAYLRRVHLFTYYNGCISADAVGSTLSGNHPTSVIHLRLKGADDILKKAKEENDDIYNDLPIGDDLAAKDSTMEGDDSFEAKTAEPKDMLVMRLDDSISKALERISGDLEVSSPFVVNETVDAVASEIESSEEKTKKDWIDNHAVIDGDGRARCSFHFCRKLFKDEVFLKKHLMKKHGEFLKAEMAKCHDSYMMNWWDQEVCRPVPQVLVDCGAKFGMVPCSVIGAAKPSVVDPEPDLWRGDQDRIRKQEEEEEIYRAKKAAAAEERSRRFTEPPADRHEHNEHNVGERDTTYNGNSNFVDVDDMKDEKVELSFKNVEVINPSSSAKKKKKKKKKLL